VGTFTNNSPSSQPSPDREKEYNSPLLGERVRVRGASGHLYK